MARQFIESAGYAVTGIRFAFRTQRNMWIHLFIALFAVFLSVMLQLSATEASIVMLVIATVFILELMNTAMEEVINMLHITRKMRAMVAKDVSAAAVLVASVAAVVIGCLIFIPKIAALMTVAL